MKQLLSLLLLILPSFCLAQDKPSASSSGSSSKPPFEAGLYAGTLLLAKIPEVIDNVPPVTLKVASRTGLGIFEVELLHARGNDMKWRSAMLDYRFDLDDSMNLPFHALFGFQFDVYQKYDGGQDFYGGGWHYGGGAHIEIVKNFWLRGDFKNRFGPGRSLLVVIGLSMGFGGGSGS